MWTCRMCGGENPSSSKFCQTCGAQGSIGSVEDVEKRQREAAAAERKRMEEEVLRRAAAEAEARRTRELVEDKERLQRLQKMGLSGYYEYQVVHVFDEQDGCVSVSALTSRLNALGREGWTVVGAFTNEVGKVSNSSGFGGYTTSTNATMEQNIIIMQRFVKFPE